MSLKEQSMSKETLPSICAKCSEEQRHKCENTEKGCDEFYEWRSKTAQLILDYFDNESCR